MEEDQFQGAGETEQRHDSFDQQPPTYNQKWDEEDDWERGIDEAPPTIRVYEQEGPSSASVLNGLAELLVVNGLQWEIDDGVLDCTVGCFIPSLTAKGATSISLLSSSLSIIVTSVHNGFLTGTLEVHVALMDRVGFITGSFLL